MTPTRRPTRFLTAEPNYDLWVRMLTGQTTHAEPGVEGGVDRSPTAPPRRVARGALPPGRPGPVTILRREPGCWNPYR